MNRRISWRSRDGGAPLRAAVRLAFRKVAGCLLTAGVIGISGCRPAETAQKSEPKRERVVTIKPQAQPERHHLATNPVNEPAPIKPHPLEGSGVVPWAKGFYGKFIAGLDGEMYEPYDHTTIARVQLALRERGLYGGPVNGILDRPTMKSIYAFQDANRNVLQRCGVPTPHTRSMLEQGSHTDLPS